MNNALLTQFDLHQRLYNNVLDGFTDEETNQRLYGDQKINHVKYLAGHLLNSQYGLAMIAGLDPQLKWNDLFAVMGHSEAKDDIEYPDIKEIKSEWNQLYEPTRDGLKELTPEILNQVPPTPFNQVAETVGELWAFINHHTSYHIGQIGILRRAFGKPPMSFD
ncbi:DinB family protein [Aliifodinibius salicampi]|uniref:DinB family protein n=1 Tax=Fodinibius salicampi TaxID=1920655 RepID=A0ABT3PXE7_9BACT|nr:DinB family protein [Fodinibius salicampi]MCW9712520.1 DinB family protein [Fodinibius salicampi]